MTLSLGYKLSSEEQLPELKSIHSGRRGAGHARRRRRVR
jgi:hypothetical protein